MHAVLGAGWCGSTSPGCRSPCWPAGGRGSRSRTGAPPSTPGTYPRLIGSAARALAPAAARLSVLSAAVLSLVLAAFGVRDVTAAVVLGVSLGVGALVHEIGHALLLRGVPSAVTSHGPRPAVLHRHVPGRRGALVTAAGPMAGVLLGAALLVPAATFSLGWLALVAIVSASQAAGFTCLSADGRKLCALH